MSQTKVRILEAALSCFMDKGVEASSINDIREASGISVGSIYHHFGNKEAIVVALFLRAMHDHAQMQETALVQAGSAEEGVKAIVACYIDWIVRNPDWARFVFRYKALVDNSELADESRHQSKQYFERLQAWFAPHIESNAVKRLPLSVYHSLIIGPAQDFALRWLKGETRHSLDQFRDLYMEAAWQSVKQ